LNAKENIVLSDELALLLKLVKDYENKKDFLFQEQPLKAVGEGVEPPQSSLK
jgi:hypothetical protein